MGFLSTAPWSFVIRARISSEVINKSVPFCVMMISTDLHKVLLRFDLAKPSNTDAPAISTTQPDMINMRFFMLFSLIKRFSTVLQDGLYLLLPWLQVHQGYEK